MLQALKNSGKAAAASVVGLVIGMSQAMAAVDVTPITDTLTDIAAVGTAVFGVYVAIKAIKFVRRAL